MPRSRRPPRPPPPRRAPPRRPAAPSRSSTANAATGATRTSCDVQGGCSWTSQLVTGSARLPGRPCGSGLLGGELLEAVPATCPVGSLGVGGRGGGQCFVQLVDGL